MAFRANPITSEQLPPETLEALRMMIGQIPLALAIMRGGMFKIKVADIDRTGGHIMSMDQENIGGESYFVFRATKVDSDLTVKP